VPALRFALVGLLLLACATVPRTSPVKPIPPRDAAIPEGEAVHNWVRPQQNQCPDARLPAPGETTPEEEASYRKTLVGLRPAFALCAKPFFDRHPFFSAGGVRLTLGVDCEGEVVSARAAAQGLDRAMVACLMRAAVTTRFDPPRAGIARVGVPATFRQ
jgi:hypothetical protein